MARRIVLFNKPFQVLSQFTDQSQPPRQTLRDYVPLTGVYPAGRLDYDSEGLMVLTDDGALQNKLANPQHKVSKTYWAQVEGEPEDAALEALREGIELKDGLTRPAGCELIADPDIWPRQPPIRYRRAIPTSWIQLTLGEGRNRQVRRMCAAIGFPVLRLIRYRVGSWTLDGLANGEWLLIEKR